MPELNYCPKCTTHDYNSNCSKCGEPIMLGQEGPEVSDRDFVEKYKRSQGLE